MQVAAPVGFNDQLALAVDRRHAALATTFDRLLLQMTPRKREALRSAWLAVEYRNGVDWSNLLRWGVPVLMVLLTALLVHGVGHWRLRREVAGRRQLEQRLAEVTDNLPAVVYQARRDADGTLSFRSSPATCLRCSASPGSRPNRMRGCCWNASSRRTARASCIPSSRPRTSSRR